MKSREFQRCILFAIAVAVISIDQSVLAQQPAAQPHTIDYAKQIKPIFASRCFACHGALKQESGLRLDTGALIRKGGEGGAVVVAGQAAKSALIERVTSADEVERMPPEGEPLTPEQIALLKAWINQGITSPADEQPEEDPRKHWSFQVPVRPRVPQVKNAAWVRNPIDAFVTAQHERRGLRPVDPATKSVLLRRVYLDLIGLPPTREQLQTFLENTSSLDNTSNSAYAESVEQLLESPHYGERWGRHWMDVWRYSDWYGRRAVGDVRNSYPHIWRWRDWIVQSLNVDKGYDRMIQEMLAADEIAPKDDAAIAATGFIVRNWFSLNYDQWMKDLVEHTGKAFLGIRMNCAHCHDHKYDPITQEEYFKFRAFFEPLEFRHDRIPGGPDLPKYIRYKPGSGSSLKPIAAGLPRIFDETLDAKTFMYRMGDARDRFDRPPVSPGGPAILGGDKLKIETFELPPQAWYPALKPFVAQQEIAKRQDAVKAAETALAKLAAGERAGERAAEQLAESERATAQTRLDAANAAVQAYQARLAADRARYLGAAGNTDKLAKAAHQAEKLATATSAKASLANAQKALAVTKAQQQVAAAMKTVAAAEKNLIVAATTSYTPLGPQYPKKSTGRRRALAYWIANPQNPLTARVAVNHMWMRHFGRPLVASVFDFGRSGQKPSHPGLLDWLAVEFMESGWSMKHLHRLIVNSNTYRMRSAAVESDRSNIDIDADNQYLWRCVPRRMEAEIIRDSVLYAAGQLDLTLGGQDLDNKLENTSRRRSLYFSVYPEDGGCMKFTGLFDAPDPGDCYRRTESIVPQQALALANSGLSLSQSRLLATKIFTEISKPTGDDAANDKAFVTAAFESVLSRPPTAAETKLCVEFLQQQVQLLKAADPKQLKSPTPKGITAPAADAALRAKQGLIHALFNHNDFVTIH